MTSAGPRRWSRLLLGALFGLGAGIAFLCGYLVAPVPEEERIFPATAVYMATTVLLMLASRVQQQKLWPLPWSALLVVVMGGLTLWLHDERFIKIRPTLLYAGMAAVAATILATRHPRLEAMLPVERLRFDTAGQRKLVLLMAGFGTAMALLNELVWRNSSDIFWIGFQIWGPILGFVLVAAVSVPMLNPHWAGQCKTGIAE